MTELAKRKYNNVKQFNDITFKEFQILIAANVSMFSNGSNGITFPPSKPLYYHTCYYY